MSKAKKIISMLLAVAMILTVAPVSVLASAADINYTYGDVSFSNTEFSVDTSATTDVIRIAQGVGSFSLPAPGSAGQIVSATPSGIPKADSGNYISIAYAKETPAYPQISFSITGVTPDAVPTISVTGINSPVISESGTPTTSGSTTTYKWDVTSGTALVGTDVVYEITYKIKGTSYKAYAFSHVEFILVMGGWVGHLTDTNGTKSDSRHAIAMQLQSKNMYTARDDSSYIFGSASEGTQYYSGMNNPGTNSNAIGYINYASEGALDDGGQALLGFGNQANLNSTINAYAAAAPNSEIPGTEVGALIKFHKEADTGRYNGCLGNDGHTSEPIVYIDRYDEDLRSLNMRATFQFGEMDGFEGFTIQEVTFHNAPHTFGSEDYDFTSSASSSEFSAVNYTSGSTGSATVSKSAGFGAYAMVPVTGTGPASSTTPDTPYGMTADIYCNNTTYVAGSINVDFRVYDSTVLRNIYYGVLHGEAMNGNASYTTPSDWSSAPSFVCNFGKGAHPQSTMYTGGWDNYLAALKTAGSLLARPDVTQAELDAAAVSLYVAYDALTGYNPTVNWEINFYKTGTTEKIIPTQTVDNIETIYTQGQPAGSIWIANAATIPGYELDTAVSKQSQNMTMSGLNATETFNFYYKAKEYNLIVDPNVDPDDGDVSVSLRQTYEKIYEDSLDYGTKEFYTFKGWYYDNGVWSQPVFSDSMQEGGMRYFEMPNEETTIYGKWEATPIDIEYVPIADGVELDHVFLDGDEVEFGDEATAKFNRPADLSVDGYLFVNYYTDAELTTAANFPIDFTLGVTQTPYKLYARMVDVNGKISFESNGGTAVNDINFTAGQTVRPDSAPTKKGYTFAGWYTKETADSGVIPAAPEYFANGTAANGWTDGSETMSSNTGFIAYAMWTPNTYSINFELGTPTTKFDTEELPSMYGLADSAINPDDIPAAPKKFGYVFHHWELNGERYELTTYPTEDITLTPYWVESDYSAFIDVTAYEKLSGTYYETSTAQTEDVITFRMTSQTNFYTGSSLFVFMYDKNFFELVNTDSAAFKLNNGSEYISGIDATHIGVTTDSSLPWPDSLATARNDYNAMMVAIDPQVTATKYSTAPMNDGEWIVEFQLRVKSDATGTGRVYMSNDWTRTPDNIMGTMFYGWSDGADDVYNTFNNVVIPDLDEAFAEITIEETETPDTKVTLYPNGGAYADAAEFKEYTGRAETEIMDYEAPTRTGYTLSGWTNRADSSVVTWTDEFYYPPEATPEAIYDANWEANMYPVTFYKDDTLSTVYYKLDYAYDSEVTGPPAAPAVQGYTFKAWVNTETGESVTLPYICKGEASFYPTYEPATNTKYVIKVNYTNNATGAVASSSNNRTGTTGYTVAIVETAGSAANTHYLTIADLPTVANYEYDPDNNTLPITGVIAADGSTIIEVNYKASIINATVKANGGKFADGTDTATISGPFQSLIAETDLPIPTRDGYNFIGWGNSFTAGTTRYTPGRTITAQWEAIKYTMTFDAGTGAYADGTKSKTAEVALNGAITAPEVPTLKGYTFKGWSLNGGEATTTLGTLAATENRTYTAVFEITPYNINYYVDGVLDAERSEVKYIGDSVTIASEPTKYGYDFSGWTFGDGSEASNFTITEEGDVDIYGEFTAAKFDVTFDANGGSWTVDGAAVETQKVSTTFGTTITTPASNPTRAGYEFLGWAVSEADAEAKNIITSFPALATTDAVTYYAAWNATLWDYKVEFYYQDVNGNYGAAAEGETLTYQGQVESEVSYNPEATKTGFTLDTDNSTLLGTVIVSEDNPLTLVVKYARNKHTLTIDIDGTKTTSDVYFGAEVSVPADPVKEGYEFSGWNGYTEGMTMPDADLTITAAFTANQYTVTYYMDETKAEVAYTRTAAYGSDYTVPSPTKEGHDFAAWKVVGTGADAGLAAGATTQIPLDGAEYYATWNVKEYNLVYRTNGGTFSDGTNTKTYPTAYGTAQADWDVPETPSNPGFTWNGWNMSNAPATMPASQVNILGQWTEESYNVIFKDSLSDEIYSDETLTYGLAVTIPEPEKEGYTFLYWADEDGNEVTPMDVMKDIGADGATVTYTAIWDALSFTITFVDTGDVAYEAITQDFGTPIEAVEDPVKTGYTFLDWDTEIPETMPAENLTITATWKINQYTITFVDTGDVAYEKITKDYKAAIGTVEDPVKTGYTFTGWSTGIPETMPAENLTITATWKINQYVITFADTGDSTIAPITQDFNTAITAPNDPTKTGYAFKGWALTANATEADAVDLPTVMPAANKTYYAIWEIQQYTISFVDTGDVAYEAITKNYGEAIGTVADPVKTGYRFVDWDKDIPEAMPAEDTVITAIWAINEYSITFDMDGGDAIAPIVQNYNTDIDADAIVPNRTGYVFAGWVDADGNKTEIPAKMPAKNLTLKATWELDQFTFTFVVYEGTEVAPLTLDYTADIDADALTSEKEGYTFIGWALNENPAEADKVDLPATMPSENRTYYAIWKINVYTVTFLDAEGNAFETQELEYKETIAAPAGTPEKLNYTFVGWSLTEVELGTADKLVDTTKLIDFENAAPTVIAGDMTIYPAFDRVVVTLKLIAGSTAVVDTERAEDPITGYIYGLRQKLKVAALTSEYLAVEGDGRLEVTPTMYGRCGTGTRVDVIDNVTDKVVEVYYIIIFGDVNGDSAVDAADISAIRAEDAGITNWSKAINVAEYDYCKVLAADIAGMNDTDGDGLDDDGYIGDGLVTVTDASELNLVVLTYKQLDQTNATTVTI